MTTRHNIFWGICMMIFGGTLAAQLPSACLSSKRDANQGAVFALSDPRSDTMDVLDYDIRLNITDFSTRIIGGSCGVTMSPRLSTGVSAVNLDLLGMTVDSVKIGNAHQSYSYIGERLHIDLGQTYQPADTFTLMVWYRGVPVTDATGWGGFYFQSPYAYNLGVGFAADPHNYGRVWFPCFDNFVERSTYTFRITTTADKYAHCNGYLVSETNNGTYNTAVWRIEETIPTYLACVAIADYAVVNSTYLSETGRIVPIELAARAADTTRVKSSFVHLNDALAAYEHWYGPYMWNKVGYSMVPFNSGAMEHATNIAYPRAFCDGTTAYETLMGHELSHHWWGDLATCSAAGDMWLNEGWATFSEFILLEHLYGRERYTDEFKNDFLDVLMTAHREDGGYIAVSGVAHPQVYSKTVYHKGAAVAHALRSYMGDIDFRTGLRHVMATRQFTHHDSYSFRDDLQAATAVPLQDFFEDWVFQGGFVDVELDSFDIEFIAGGQYHYRVYLQQKSHHAPRLYNNMPVTLACIDINGQETLRRVMVSGDYTNLVIQVPAPLTKIYVNAHFELPLAEMNDVITPGSSAFAFTREKVSVVSSSGVGSMRVQHHLCAPDPIRNPDGQFRLSSSHWWEIDVNQGAYAMMRFNFDGRASNNEIDLDLLAVTEDSIRLMYRIDAHDDWHPYLHANRLHSGSHSDRSGYFLADSLVAGQYCFANASPTLANEQTAQAPVPFKVYPNPASDLINVEGLSTDLLIKQVRLYDFSGKLISEHIAADNKCQLRFAPKSASGFCLIEITDIQGNVWTQKVLLK